MKGRKKVRRWKGRVQKYINERVGGRNEEREGVLGNRALAALPSTEIPPLLHCSDLFCSITSSDPRPYHLNLTTLPA